jgi:hypothetical protein
MPTDWLSLGLSGVGGIANAIFGDKGGTKYSPEVLAYLAKLEKELMKTDSELGIPPAQRAILAQKLRKAIDENSGRAIGGYQASAARRGMGLQPGQTAGMATDVLASAGKDYSEGIQDMDLSALQMGKQRRESLEGKKIGLLGMGTYEPGTDFGETFGSLANTISYASNKPEGDDMDFTQGFGSNPNFNQRQQGMHQQYPQAFGRQRMRWNPQTGRFEWVNE